MKTLPTLAAAAAVLSSVAAFDANAACGDRGSGCNGPGDGTTIINNDRRTQVRVEGDRTNFVAAPGMAVSSGWCMESISASIGIASTPIALGLSKSDFSKLCGQWAAVTSGASNPTCPVGMYSVIWATLPEGTRNREGLALQQAINVCTGAPMPRNRGG